MESETEKRRHQARDYIATHPTIISPDSIFRKIWDGSQIFLLVYVAVAVPYRLAFNKIVILWSSWFFFDGFIRRGRWCHSALSIFVIHKAVGIPIHYKKSGLRRTDSTSLKTSFVQLASTSTSSRTWSCPSARRTTPSWETSSTAATRSSSTT